MLNKPIFRLKAFSLIEISLTLLILGIVASSGMYLFKALNAQYKYQTNVRKHQIILNALGAYVARNQHLPLPSLDELGDSQEITTYQNLKHIKSIGFVPYKALKLPFSASLDAFGKPITYIIHPALAPKKDIQIAHDKALYENIANTNWESWCYLKNEISDQQRNFINILYALEKPKGSFGTYTMTAEDCFPIFQITNRYIQHQEQTKIVDVNDKAQTTTAMLNFNKIQGRPMVNVCAKVCDCIAVVLISGEHDLINQEWGDGSAKYQVKLNPSAKHLTSFVTRFNMHLYGAPKCKPCVKNKAKLTILQHAESMKSIESATDSIAKSPLHPPAIGTEKGYYIATSFIDTAEQEG